MKYEDLKRIAIKDGCQVNEFSSVVEIAPKYATKEFYKQCRTTICYFDEDDWENEDYDYENNRLLQRGNFYMPMPSMYSYELSRAIVDFAYTPEKDKGIEGLIQRTNHLREKEHKEAFMKYAFPIINKRKKSEKKENDKG